MLISILIIPLFYYLGGFRKVEQRISIPPVGMTSTEVDVESPMIGSSPSPQRTLETSSKEAQLESQKREKPFKSLKNKPRYWDPGFSKFQSIDRKALPSAEDIKSLKKMLSSAKLLKLSGEFLNDTSYLDKLDDNQERRRMLRINFLGKALHWENNPARDDVIEIFKEVILNESSIRKNMDLDLKKSLAGDKVELFWILKKYEPDAIENIMIEAHGKPTMKILKYAIEHYQEFQGRF